MSSNPDLADTEAARPFRTPLDVNVTPEGAAGHTFRFSVLDDRTHVVALQEKLGGLQNVAQRLNLQYEINRLLSPLGCIPPEVLCYIFTLALLPVTVRTHSIPNHVSGPRCRKDSRYLGPWLFGQVCHYWCDLSLSFPTLWSSIVVSGKIGPREMERLEEQLDRSGKASLDILLWFTPQCYSWGCPHFHTFLGRLVGESHRWRTIRFELDTFPRRQFPELDALVAPLLQEVVFSGQGAMWLQNWNCFKDAPSLRRVVLSSPGAPSVPKIPLPWKQITTYKATCPDGSTHFNNLSAAVSLVDCDMDFRINNWGKLEQVPDERVLYAGTVTLSHLRRLVITRDLFLDCLVAPALTELQVHGSLTCVPTFLRRSARALTHLTLFMCNAPAAEVVSLLYSTSSITALAIDFLGPPVESNALISALVMNPSSPENALCPKLTSLSWGDRNDTIDRVAFADMVESRWRVSGGIHRRLHVVRVYLGRLGMKASGRRLQAFTEEGMDVVIWNARKGKPAMNRWRNY